MTTQEIAGQLVSYCRQGLFEEAQRALYAADAVSIEPEDMPTVPRETKGLAAIIEKGRGFSASLEQVHAMQVSDPVVAAESFACTMSIDATMKGRGRFSLHELCVYQVRAGKIVSESFHR